MSYIVLPAAQADLQAIDEWIVENFGEAAAVKAEDKLYRIFELLTKFPEMGIERPEVDPRAARFFSLPPNWIVYTPGDPLLIHRVFSARMDMRDLEI